MLIGKGTRKINLPHEKGQWIEVQDLPRAVIAESKRLRMMEVMDTFGDKMSQMDVGDLSPEVIAEAKKEQTTVRSYDIDHVLNYAIVGWSYDEKFSKDGIARLDQKTAEFVAADLLGIETEGDREKG